MNEPKYNIGEKVYFDNIHGIHECVIKGIYVNTNNIYFYDVEYHVFNDNVQNETLIEHRILKIV